MRAMHKCVRCGIDSHGYACKDCTTGIDAAQTRAWAVDAREADMKRKAHVKFMDYVFERPDNARRRGTVGFA